MNKILIPKEIMFECALLAIKKKDLKLSHIAETIGTSPSVAYSWFRNKRISLRFAEELYEEIGYIYPEWYREGYSVDKNIAFELLSYFKQLKENKKEEKKISDKILRLVKRM
ncbi:MAG: hypothetical protein R3321_04900 [Nitrososphaeraceae archaeon]|nr:hypothetical protein [Nitrososphaeraceae archaeon]